MEKVLPASIAVGILNNYVAKKAKGKKLRLITKALMSAKNTFVNGVKYSVQDIQRARSNIDGILKAA